jgi:hypothetical protein
MNTAEIDLFNVRSARFNDLGLNLSAGEMLADRLVTRDREYDDRTVCYECIHLRRSGRCGNWHRADVAVIAWNALLVPEFLVLLKHCDGFRNA